MESVSLQQRAWRRFRSNPVAGISGVFLAVVVLLVLVWPLFHASWTASFLPKGLRHSPVEISDAQFQPPSAEYWMGTDVHGRDQMSRIFYGARISLLVGLVGALVSLVIGVLWGAIAGYIGGRTDGLMMRFVDILYSLPSIVFVIVLITTTEPLIQAWAGKRFSSDVTGTIRLIFLFIGIGAVSWLTMARIVRGQVLSLRSRQFVDASRALGATHTRLLLRHILPNVYGVIIVYLTLTVPAVVLYESFLSFLGLGIQPPMASWGVLISEGASQLNPIRIYWWLIVFPAVTMVSTLLALNFFGDGLRDALDPRAEK